MVNRYSEQEHIEYGKAVLFGLGTPLHSPIKVGRSQIPPGVRKELTQFMRPAPAAFFCQCALCWVVILASIFLATRAHSPWITIGAIMIVATRQNLLALLMHEQTHWLGSRSKWVDYFCELLIAFPLLVTLEGYRRVHLSHHTNYFGDNDPDYIRKQGKEWTFPQHTSYFFLSLLRDLAGTNLWKTLKSKGMADQASLVKVAFCPPLWLRPTFFAALIIALTVTHTWKLYLVFWILPLFTIMQLIVKWGAVSEHKYNLINPSIEESTPLIELRWWERMLFPNLNFTLHIYHHWYPTIPGCHLLHVHELFRRAGLIEDRYVFHGYFEYLLYLLNEQEQHSLPMSAGD